MVYEVTNYCAIIILANFAFFFIVARLVDLIILFYLSLNYIVIKNKENIPVALKCDSG